MLNISILGPKLDWIVLWLLFSWKIIWVVLIFERLCFAIKESKFVLIWFHLQSKKKSNIVWGLGVDALEFMSNWPQKEQASRPTKLGSNPIALTSTPTTKPTWAPTKGTLLWTHDFPIQCN
jgi:hypothetical protein